MQLQLVLSVKQYSIIALILSHRSGIHFED